MYPVFLFLVNGSDGDARGGASLCVAKGAQGRAASNYTGTRRTFASLWGVSVSPFAFDFGSKGLPAVSFLIEL